MAAINELDGREHTRYLDSEAVAAMGAKADGNALHHDRYTDAAAVSAMGSKADGNALAHDRYTDAAAVSAMGSKAAGNALHHDRYTDAEALAVAGTKATTNALHHDRYTDGEAVSAMGTKATTNPLHHDAYTDTNAVAAFPQRNLTATAPPTGSDDSTAGYAPGSLWVDGQSRTSYRLTAEPSTGSAAWKATSGSRRRIRLGPVYASGSEDPTASGTRLKAVMAAITDATAANPYLIELDPGTYDIGSSLTLKSYVTIRGAGMDATLLRGAPGGGRMIVASAEAGLEDLQITHSASGGYAFRQSSGTVVLRRVAFELPLGGTAFVELTGGLLRLHECRVAVKDYSRGLFIQNGADLEVLASKLASTSGSIIMIDPGGATPSDITIRDSEIAITGAAFSNVGLEVSTGGAIEVTGTRFRQSGGRPVGVDLSSGNKVIVRGCEFDLETGADEALGIRLSGVAAGVVISGNTLRVSSTVADATGMEVSSDGAVVSGNTVDVRGTVNSVGIQIGGDAMAVGNGIRVEGGAARGIWFRTGVGYGSGNSIDAVGTLFTSYGISASRGANLLGNTVRISGSATETYGMQLSASGADPAVLAGGSIEVSGSAPAFGVRGFFEAKVVSGLRLEVSSSAGAATGFETTDQLLVSGSHVQVTGSGANDATLFDTDPRGDDVRVVGSVLTVLTGTGTAYVADNTDGTTTSAGDDLRVFDSRVARRSSPNSVGADVTCTDSSGC